MATIDAIKQVGDDGYVTVTWETLESGDDGAPVRLGRLADKTVQVTGAFDGETVTMQGSMDGTNWFPLTDGSGTVVEFAAAGGSLIAENPLWVRPLCDGVGTTVDLDVVIGASTLA